MGTRVLLQCKFLIHFNTLRQDAIGTPWLVLVDRLSTMGDRHSKNEYIHTYMLHTYINTYIHTYAHTYIHTLNLNTSVQIYMHTYIIDSAERKKLDR